MDSSKNHNGILKITAALVSALIVVVTTLSLFITAGLRNDIKEIDSKIFVHLTNHEIHIPRGQVVTKAEFDIYCYTSEKNLERVMKELKR